MSFKNRLKTLVYRVAASACPRFVYRNTALILMYHSVDTNGLFFSVTPDAFAEQMEYLHTHNYHVVTLSQLRTYMHAGVIPSRTIVITFDDGLEDNYVHAFPVLKQYQYPAHIFVPTGFIDGQFIGKKYELPVLKTAQMQEMQASGLIHFEPHTVHHPKLPQLDAAGVRAEIKNSKDALTTLFGSVPQFFAYPSGQYTDEIVRAVEEIGFDAACTVQPGFVRPNSPQFTLARNAIDSAVTFGQFKALLKISKI